LAVKPHEVVGEELTADDLATIARWETWLDGRLLTLRHDKSTLAGQRSFSLCLGRLSPAVRVWLGALPTRLIPELLARYAATGWDVDYQPRRRKIGKQGAYVEHRVRFTAPEAERLPPAPYAAPPRPATAPMNKRGGYVYLLEAENGLYKIGRSRHPRFRIAELTKAVAPFKIKAINTAWYPDCHVAERELHERFKDRRRRGEWFELSSTEVREVIEHAYTPV